MIDNSSVRPKRRQTFFQDNESNRRIDTWPNGRKYEGDNKDDKTTNNESCTFSDGSNYDGEWKDGHKNGIGIYIWLDGSKYDGEWKNDLKHGKGVYTRSDGRRFEGVWKDDKKNGRGVYTDPNGRRYEGDWKDDKRNGKGVYTYPNGKRYEGDWKDDKRNGKGVYTDPNGKRYEGVWKNGGRKMNGRGVYTYTNGGRYEGNWENGLLCSRRSYAKNNQINKENEQRNEQKNEQRNERIEQIKIDMKIDQLLWQWLDNGDIWKTYDSDLNNQINSAFERKLSDVTLHILNTGAQASHIIDLDKQTITVKSTQTVNNLKQKPDGWYENDTKLPDIFAATIDLKTSEGKLCFELFLNKYKIDFKKMVQINCQTHFEREVRARANTNHSMNKIVEEAGEQIPIQQITVPTHFSLQSLEYLVEKIKKNKITVKGELKAGRTVILTGEVFQLSKITKLLGVLMAQQPEEFKAPAKWAPMDGSFQLITLHPDEQEWEQVYQKFESTMGWTTIKSIKRIQNRKFWRDYNHEKKDISEARKRAGLNEEIKEQLLWHGTRATDPSTIYQDEEESFDLVYANDGMWGRGLYFAENASYSAAYAYNSPQNTKIFILARVMIGDSITLEPDNTLRKAPLRQDTMSQIKYESVKGHSYGSEIYVLYHMRRAYPEYLIEFY